MILEQEIGLQKLQKDATCHYSFKVKQDCEVCLNLLMRQNINLKRAVMFHI